jgi:glycerol kinase
LTGLADVDALTALGATSSGESEICFVPALAGFGAPHWKDRARAALTGASLATSRADVARATLEAIAVQICDVLRAMEGDLGATLATLSVDGGATRNDPVMQWQAELLGRPVQRVKILELSAFGAGALAGLATGFFDGATIEARLREAVDVIAPRLDESARIAKAQVWRAAVHSVVNSAAARRPCSNGGAA